MERDRTSLTSVLKRIVADALSRGAEPHDVAAALIEATPELVDRRAAHANVERAFDAYHENVPEIEGSTEPFVRVIDGYEKFIDAGDSDQPIVDLGGFSIKNA